MSRFKTTVRWALVAVVMGLAAGTPAAARTTAARDQAHIGRQEKQSQPSVWRSLVKRFSRYAMAAN